MDATTDAPRSNNRSTISSPAASSFVLRVGQGKGNELVLLWEDVALVGMLLLLFGDAWANGL